MTSSHDNVIEDAATLPQLFRQRVQSTPDSIAYRFYDALNDVWVDYSWAGMKREVARWQAALARAKLKPGERVAIMAPNSRFWVMFDQASLGMGLVNVPLFSEDRADNVEFILRQTESRLLVISGSAQWERLKPTLKKLKHLKHIISIGSLNNEKDHRLATLSDWLPQEENELREHPLDEDDLATIVYTSGTTGNPKGVMLSHKNILSNVKSCLQTVTVTGDNVFLSFLPLSHMLERTVGYYLPLSAGATVAHVSSISGLANDLQTIRPTVLISVPRIYERVYDRIQDQLQSGPALRRKLFFLAADIGWDYFNYRQGRGRFRAAFLLWPLLKRLVADRILARLGGRLRIAISGGAPLADEISRVFVGLGVPLLQGYGLTETSPVVCVNRLEDNIPDSIGPPIPDVEVKLDADGELLTRGDNVMLGYWKNPDATKQAISEDGWLHTGDKARIENNHVYITGRIKDIMVMSTGEKVSPADIELAIGGDPLFDHVILIGESRPYLSALIVLNNEQFNKLMENELAHSNEHSQDDVEQVLLDRINNQRLHAFPSYAAVRRITCIDDEWTVENGLLTPTMKIKRNEILSKYADEIEAMYEGHGHVETS